MVSTVNQSRGDLSRDTGRAAEKRLEAQLAHMVIPNMNQSDILMMQARNDQVAKINKYKRKLKKYLQKNKELTGDLQQATEQLEAVRK